MRAVRQKREARQNPCLVRHMQVRNSLTGRVVLPDRAAPFPAPPFVASPSADSRLR
jgi:hypothetical protein